MNITRIEVQNYRLLKNFSIDIEKELSLVIGKNNCGKTSLLTVLDKFLNGTANSFSFNDFNLDYKKELRENIEGLTSTITEATGIKLKVFIEYTDRDNLSSISKLMMDLDPTNNKICLLFEYILTIDELTKIKVDYNTFKTLETAKTNPKDINYFLSNNYTKYFSLKKKSVELGNDNIFIDIEKEKISLKDIINYKYIKANRDVSNKELDKSLSSLSSKIYEGIETDEVHQTNIDKFKEALCDTDSSLDIVYEDLFETTIDKVKKFGGIRPDDTKITITSSLQHKDLLKGNTTVKYLHDDVHLPENYNGLGYMNLISMIFEVEILINEFKRTKYEKPADINLLFIEEPEAHTHPQMQYVFIKNIKALLKDCICRHDGENRDLQYIISTHSSHIVAESEFDDIKYLKRDKNSVLAKNLKDLQKEYTEVGEDQNYKFLKQYLTLHRAELFFADKAIFIEGDTERILLPAMMKKIDQDNPDNPLLSQNISIIEVGNYSHIFEKFIDFFGIKSLIVTDIDSAKSDRTKCKVDDINAIMTTNSSLHFFYGNTNTLSDFKSKALEDLKLKKDETTKKWINNTNGYLVCVYQTKENNSNSTEYHARSFEDSFFHLNRQFIIDNKDTFKSLKNIDYFEDITKDVYELAEKCIDKKPAFAIEVLLNSKIDEVTGKNFSNWQTPAYINQGLLWLKD
nr:ATP-dependent endonuclease [Candidatus Gracilibacteria bacterium]